LDPNRVLDIILESFENNPHMHKTYIELLKEYKSDEDSIGQIVGFKFQSLHQEQRKAQQQLQQQLQQMQFSVDSSEQNKSDSDNRGNINSNPAMGGSSVSSQAGEHHNHTSHNSNHIGHHLTPYNYFIQNSVSQMVNIDSLYLMTAYLLKYEIIELESLMPHVSIR
jgi:THO complex subunit 2